MKIINAADEVETLMMTTPTVITQTTAMLMMIAEMTTMTLMIGPLGPKPILTP